LKQVHRLRWGRAAVQRLPSATASPASQRIRHLNLIGSRAFSFRHSLLNQFRAGLIDAKVQSLLTQGEIIAGRSPLSAGVDTTRSSSIRKRLEATGTSSGPTDERRSRIHHRS
jgi:two-component system sensor histidine kinase ChvG